MHVGDFTLISDLDVLKDMFTMKLRHVPNTYIYKFRNVLKEGEAYFIKNPNLAKMDKGKFQLTNQMQRLTFNRETTVTPCLDFSGSVVGFAFIDYHPIIVTTKFSK
uniref:DUF223 domain-containing protein n=1 Tax=Lactuca sativa TaxID=4236 RepID=A0A9R1UNP1_LACSA|nr:hypothetical protein LSAT_V11C800407650 [Lactuca sativa]